MAEINLNSGNIFVYKLLNVILYQTQYTPLVFIIDYENICNDRKCISTNKQLSFS